MLVDGEVFQGFDSLTNVSVNLNGSVAVSRPENNSFVVTFPSGISVTVTEVQESLSIVFAAPVSFKGYTKGLLGTWNDNPLDDFLRPDGTTLAYNATGREIHSSFGQKCKLLDSEKYHLQLAVLETLKFFSLIKMQYVVFFIILLASSSFGTNWFIRGNSQLFNYMVYVRERGDIDVKTIKC